MLEFKFLCYDRETKVRIPGDPCIVKAPSAIQAFTKLWERGMVPWAGWVLWHRRYWSTIPTDHMEAMLERTG